ncbi:MAG: hypothetical protein V4492_05680 [Chlamydiota bacterium]
MAEINITNSSSSYLYIIPLAGGPTLEIPYPFLESPIDELASELAQSTIEEAQLTLALQTSSTTAPNASDDASSSDDEMDWECALLPSLAPGEPRPLPPLPSSEDTPMIDEEVDDLDALWNETLQILPSSFSQAACEASVQPFKAISSVVIQSCNNVDDIELLWHMVKFQNTLSSVNNQK